MYIGVEVSVSKRSVISLIRDLLGQPAADCINFRSRRRTLLSVRSRFLKLHVTPITQHTVVALGEPIASERVEAGVGSNGTESRVKERGSRRRRHDDRAMLLLLRPCCRLAAHAQRVMIGFRQIHFRRQRRPSRGIAGFHERLTGMPTIACMMAAATAASQPNGRNRARTATATVRPRAPPRRDAEPLPLFALPAHRAMTRARFCCSRSNASLARSSRPTPWLIRSRRRRGSGLVLRRRGFQRRVLLNDWSRLTTLERPA